jgi:RNA polymerase sigma-70 factor (ECF subfamily)
MLEDRLLIWRFNRGDPDALSGIYMRYKNDLLNLALSLVNNFHLAEDILHDVFVSFARQSGRFELKGSLRGFLCVCIANRTRDLLRARYGSDVSLENIEMQDPSPSPVDCAALSEETVRLHNLLGQIPYSQREVIVLHLHHDLSFRKIASSLGVSINTVQSRYRYGIERLGILYIAENGHETKRNSRRLDSAK